ncbi:hypothetical protein [Nocardioides sp. GXZ039]|uniref:hypothetical protein n=1 Tax=Nocardioides sp. GXZ039 TaxID=3136018 RepID=UPI0030F43249
MGALRAAAGPLLHLAATVAVLTGAVLVAVAAAGPEGRVTGAVALVLLGLVVVPSSALELARRQRAEVTLARVRGASVLVLARVALGRPLAAVVLGTAAGMGAGTAVVSWRSDAWALTGSGAGSPLTWSAVAAAVSLALSLGTCAWAAREPLSVALVRPHWRPGGRGVGALDAVTVAALVVAALLVLYRSRSDDGGVLVLAGPALLGIAAGQVLVVGLRRLAPVAVGTDRPTAALLALRRVFGGDHGGRTRAVVAAGIVLVAAISAAVAVHDWADRSARIDAGAPVRLPIDDDALSVLEITRELDPEGRWLMAGAVTASRAEAEQRTVWLDLERYERVAGDFLSGTGFGLSTGSIDRLRDAAGVALVSGTEVTATRADATKPVTLTLTYRDDDDVTATATIDLAAGARGGSAKVLGCTTRCVVVSLGADAPTEVTELRLGEHDLAAEQWGGAVPLDPDTPSVPSAGAAAEPVLTAGRPEWPETGPAVAGIGGGSRSAEVIGRPEALPLVAAAGSLADLPVALAAAPASVPDVDVLVLAREDTPDEILTALAEAGAEPPVRFAASDAEVVLGPARAGERRTLVVVAVGAALLGALALLAGRRRRALEARRESAALRLIGLPPALERRARVLELGVRGGVVLLVVALVGAVAAAALGAAGLVPTGPDLPSFGGAVVVPVVLLGAAAAAIACVLGDVAPRLGASIHSEPAALLSTPENGAGR